MVLMAHARTRARGWNELNLQKRSRHGMMCQHRAASLRRRYSCDQCCAMLCCQLKAELGLWHAIDCKQSSASHCIECSYKRLVPHTHELSKCSKSLCWYSCPRCVDASCQSCMSQPKQKPQKAPSEEELKEQFSHLDKNNTGNLTASDLKVLH